MSVGTLLTPNARTGFTDIDHDYRADLVELLGRNKLDPIRSAGADE
jgi:hypothetical protein